MKPAAPHSIRRVVLAYALFAGLWILLSDRLLIALVSDAGRLTILQSYKGWVFVLVSALLLEVLLRRDIAQRLQAERALRKSNRALKVIRECNQALVRARTETEAIREICGLLVEHGGYPGAWIGFAEQDGAKTVRPVAQAGFEDGYLHTVNLTWADEERGRDPTGAAIRTGKPVIARNISTDPSYGSWRAAAIQRGFASSIALPLVSEGKPIGALTAYASETDAFDTEEVALLTELAGDLAYGLAALRNRAERERAEEALRQSQALVQVVINGTSDAIYVKDIQGRYLLANAGTLEFLRGTESEVIGQDDMALFPPEDARQIMVGDRRVMDSGTIQTYEELLTINGQPRAFLSTKGPWRDDQGRVAGLFGIARDITDRKQAAAALHREQSFSEAILKSLPGVVYCYDREFRFLRWNKNFERVLGYTNGEIARMSPLDCFAVSDKERVAARIQEVFEKGVSDVEADFVAKDGTRTPYYFSGLRVEIDGQPHLVGVGVDITERKRAEAKITEQLEELRRWHEALEGREGRVLEVKREVNELLARFGEPPRYPSAETEGP